MDIDRATVLHLPGESPLHVTAPEVKVVAALLVVLCVVATPREQFWAFGGYAVLVLCLVLLARVPLRWMAARSLIETPFLVLAILLPFTAGGVETQVWGGAVSVEGLYAGANIVVKGTLGVWVSLLLAATTSASELLTGMRRLRVPALVTTIASLMLRYVAVLVAEARRMRLARISRGDDPRWWSQTGATARGVGTLFVRSYERGERVHLAMVSRGGTGSLPDAEQRRTPVSAWFEGLAPVAVTASVMAVALWTG